MKPIRIQLIDKDPPENNPFEFDLLNREEAVKTLTRLIGAIEEGPCVLAVDAPWGAGKTTFLKIWAQYLRNEQFSVVEFNAWKTDFSNDPFMALCAELTRGFGEGKSSGYAKEVKKAAAKVIKHIGSNAMNISSIAIEKMTIGLVVPTKLWAYLNEKAAEERLNKYQKAQDVIKEFKEKLEGLARARNKGIVQSKTGGHKPLVVMIDELDRCRPSYAIELLETAKHLFDVDQIVFVLAVNREQLGYAVRALYGADFNAEGYLRRFFDLDFRLPEPERSEFIKILLDSTNIEQSLIRNTLQAFFDVSPLTLRDIDQAVHRIGLVLNSLSGTRPTMEYLVAIALILRTLDKTLYSRFVHKEITDRQVVEEIFNNSSINIQQWEPYGIQFQIGLVLAYKELSVITTERRTPQETAIERHLEGIQNNEERHLVEEQLKNAYDQLQGEDTTGTDFKDAYRHIELFSSDHLIDTGPQIKQSIS